MRIALWWCLVGGLASLAPGSAGAWGGEPLSPAALVPDSQQLAAIPPPPSPPPVPAGLLPDDDGTTVEPEPSGQTSPRDAATDPGPQPGDLVLEGAIFEDPRADVLISLPPGIPVPTYPIVMNATVESLVDYFTARERERFGLWLARSGRYLDMIRQIFRERGLPEELAYTAMIESGFSPRAVSRVGAKGLWQFMEATARRYGLVVNRWVDERFDPVKSTVAAAKYLGDLYGMFGHWFLAQAAYNAGEARVERAITRAKTSDFWALTQTRHLPNETKRFVPQILAAAVITRAPARYGFEVTLEAPLAYDEVTVKRVLDFETIAGLAEVPVDEVRELNPALRGGVTPPFGSYVLRLPPGVGPRFEAALHEAHPSRLSTWGLHRIARNQTLAEIARLYRTTPQRLSEVNQLRGGRLRGVTELLVPVSHKVAAVTRPSGKGGDLPSNRPR
jgi:peptidoglycan lytic transglycosylase D